MLTVLYFAFLAPQDFKLFGFPIFCVMHTKLDIQVFYSWKIARWTLNINQSINQSTKFFIVFHFLLFLTLF